MSEITALRFCHLHFQLAQGLEKHRNDYCITIWDVNMKYSPEYLGERPRYSSNVSEHAISKPWAEIGKIVGM